MSCAKAGDRFAGLGKRDSVPGMCMHDGANACECLEQSPMSWRVRRRPHRTANLLALEIDKHDVVRLELGVD